MDKVFNDIKIVEFANVLAGPSVGMFFAELGAEVIKIENPKTGGDITRKWKLPSEDPNGDSSVYYSCINYGKTSMFLDVTNPEQWKEIKLLIKSADIVVSNFKPSFRDKFHLNYDDFKAIKPDLIYAELNAYPDVEKPAFDILLQAETGFLAMCGTGSDQLAKIPVALIDVIAGHQLKEAILTALINRYKTGRGGYVKTSLYESAIASLINQGANYLQSGFIPTPQGTIHSNIAPYGDIYYDLEGMALVLAIGTERQFLKLLKCLGLDIKDEWLTNQLRIKNRSDMNASLQFKIGQWSQSKVSDVFLAQGIPFAYIQNIGEVLDNRARNEVLLLNKKIVKSVAFELMLD